MNKSLIASGILVIMLAFGITDALLLEQDILADWRTPVPAEPTEQTANSSASSQANVPLEGVQKLAEPDVTQVLQVLGFEQTAVDEITLIEQIVPSELAETEKYVILKNGDRAGIIAWVDSSQVKMFFLALKEALHSTFSPQVQDLVDETQQRASKPTRNILTFKDPQISEERVVFVRIRQRLYEFRVADGMDQPLFELVETLTE